MLREHDISIDVFAHSNIKFAFLLSQKSIDMISTRQLRYFVEVVDAASYSKAAEHLYIAQSALSRQIKELENEINAVLLKRDARHVDLTPAGKCFYDHARQILLKMDEAIQETRQISKGEQGVIRLYHSSSVTLTPELGRILNKLLEIFPGVSLDISRASSEHQAIEIDEGRADLGLIRLPVLRTIPNVVMQELFRERLVVAVSKNHMLARQGETHIASLREEYFVSVPHKDRGGLSYLVAELCRSHGFLPKMARATSRKTSLLHLIDANLGIAIIPESMCAVAPEGVRFLSLPEQESESVVGLIHARTPSTMIRQFTECLISEVRQLSGC